MIFWFWKFFFKHNFLQKSVLYTSQSNKISVYSSSSFTNNNKKLGILQKYIFHRSSLFFYDNTIFHLLIASKITPKKYWYYFYIFIGIFFQSAIKNLQWTAILLRVPSYYPTFSPTTIIYEHIHAIVLLSVYLQYSIHFNLWFSCYQRMVTTFPLLKTIKWRKRNCNYQGMFVSRFVGDILIKNERYLSMKEV